MRVLLHFLVLLTATSSFAYTPSEIISSLKFSDYSKENTALVSDAVNAMFEYAKKYYSDPDFSTLKVVASGQHIGQSGFVDHSKKKYWLYRSRGLWLDL